MGEDMTQLMAFTSLSFGFQFYLVAFAFYGYRLGGNNLRTEDETIQSFFIMGFLAYAAAWILTLLMKYGQLGGKKIVIIITMLLAYGAAFCILVAISVYADNVNNVPIYSFPTFCIGMLLGLFGGVCLTLAMCGK